MKAKTIRETESPNPEFDAHEYQRACVEGRPYAVPHTIKNPPGKELAGPKCWIHCVPGHRNSPPVAEPADDECRDMVSRWMAQRGVRLGVLAKAVAANEAGRVTDPVASANLDVLADAYKDELPKSKGKKA